jgi:hypothetical protein
MSGIAPNLYAALRKGSGGSVACMLGRASIRASQARSAVSFMAGMLCLS